MKRFLGVAAVALAIGSLATAGSARANTVTVIDLGTTNPSISAPLVGPNVTITMVNNAPIVNGGGQNTGTIVGTNGNNPIGNSNTYTDFSVGWDPFGQNDSNNQWLSIGGSGGGTFNGAPAAAALFDISNPVDVLEFVWGSSSVTNTVSLYSGLDGTGAFLGSVVADGNSNLYVYNSSDVLTSVVSNPNLVNYSGPGPIIEIESGQNFSSALLTTNYGTGGFEIGGVVSGVPEPATWAMMMIGFVGVGFRMRRKAAAA